MQIFKKILCCLFGVLFLFSGYACSKAEKTYEIVMEVNVDGEVLYAEQPATIVETNIGTAPFQHGYFPVRVSFQVKETGSHSYLKEWYPLESWGGLSPSELYGSKVDLQSYTIYDENGTQKNQMVKDWDSRDFFNRRHNSIDHIDYFYLANISGLHEIIYKVNELPEYNIPETIFTIKLYAEEDERVDGVEIIAEDDPNITKINGGEECYDLYLISPGGNFPKFKIYDKDTGKDLREDYTYYIRRFEPNYEENAVISDSLKDIGKINWVYVQFNGNELYQPKSYYFYVIYL